MAILAKKLSEQDPIDPNIMTSQDLIYIAHKTTSTYVPYKCTLADLLLGVNNVTSEARFNGDTVVIKDGGGMVGINKNPNYALDVSGDIASSGDIFITGTIRGAWSGLESGTKMLFVQTTAPTGWTKDTTHNDKALRVVSGNVSTGGSKSFSSAFTTSVSVGSGVVLSSSLSSASGSVSTSTTTSNTSLTVSGTVGGTAITTDQLPSHSHTITDPGHNHNFTQFDTLHGSSGFAYDAHIDPVSPVTSTTGIVINSTGGGSTHTHSWTGNISTSAHNHVATSVSSFTPTPHSHTTTVSGLTADMNVQYVDVIIATKD